MNPTASMLVKSANMLPLDFWNKTKKCFKRYYIELVFQSFDIKNHKKFIKNQVLSTSTLLQHFVECCATAKNSEWEILDSSCGVEQLITIEQAFKN